MLTQLFYTSLSRRARGHESDFVILQEALENNRRDGLTGYLLRGRGRFYQVLEGPGSVVEKTFDRIAGDARHTAVSVMMRREVSERAFLGWSMGYADLAADDTAWFDNCLRAGTRGVVVQFDRLAKLAGARALPIG